MRWRRPLRAALAVFAALMIMAPVQEARAACTNPAAEPGTIIFNDSLKIAQYCSDTVWRALNKAGTGAGNCTDPAGNAGAMIMSENENAPLVCSNGQWMNTRLTGNGTVFRDYRRQIYTRNILYLENNEIYVHDQNDIFRRVPDYGLPGNHWVEYSHSSRSPIRTECGVRADGGTYCWGYNVSGVTGTGLPDALVATPAPLDTTNVTGTRWQRIQVRAGGGCALRDDGTLYCWGTDGNGQLGNGAGTTHSTIPSLVSLTGVTGTAWTDFSIGPYSACGLRDNGTAYCWGYNVSGSLGTNTATNPVQAPRALVMATAHGTRWEWISSGISNVCGARDSGHLYCSGGFSNLGLPGSNRMNLVNIPNAAGDGTKWVSVDIITTGSVQNICARRDSGNVWCIGSTIDDYTVFDLNGFRLDNRQYKALAGTMTTAYCGITAEDDFICRHNSLYGWLPYTTHDSNEFRHAFPEFKWKFVGNGDYVRCGITLEDRLYCWGENMSDSVGNYNGFDHAFYPFEPVPGTQWKMATTANYFSCGVQMNDTGWCWGSGMGSQGMPQEMISGQRWERIDGGSINVCGITKDTGQMYCWGDSYAGGLGSGSSVTGDFYTTPQLVDTTGVSGTRWIQAAGLLEGMCGLRDDFTLYCWGTSEVVFGNYDEHYTPQPVYETMRFKRLMPSLNGDYWTEALCMEDFDGLMHCVGHNEASELGIFWIDEGSTPVTTPTQIFDPAGWQQVAPGHYGGCGVKTNNDLYCWGTWEDDDVFVWPPQKMPGKFGMISMGLYDHCGIDINNDLYCWVSEVDYSDNRGLHFATYKPHCTEPRGEEGAIRYSGDDQRMYYCAGFVWRRMGM